MIRILFFISIAVVSLSLPWYVAILGACLYAFLYEGVELIVLGFFLDAYVGYAVPWLMAPAIYTISMTGILMFFWGLKPLLYITDNDTAS